MSAERKEKEGKKAPDKGSITPKPINLALQGGGAHGAFTWGVLDKILEDGRVIIEAISGTSAGAMNAVVTADGLMQGGSDAARKKLRDFWKAISDAARWSPVQRTPIDFFMGNWNLDNSPSYLAFDFLTRTLSPYTLNPLNINPLREIVDQQVDFERVRSCDKMKLFICATTVRTGRIKLFSREELTLDMVMASGCLPFLYQAVEIEGESYWDGGYMGNPPLYPFAYRCACSDVVLVQINPLGCRETPRNAREILNRLNEVTFNASLLRELRAIDFVGRLLEEGALDPDRYKKMLIHMIDAEKTLEPLNASSKMNAEWAFLKGLHNVGWQAATRWLDKNFDSIGKKPTVDIRSLID